MAVWIRAGLDPEPITPKDGKIFTLSELQELVGGYIEALQLTNGLIMWLNEDGKGMRLPANPVADLIAHHHCRIAFNDCIVGDVVLASREESGEADGPEADENYGYTGAGTGDPED